MNNSIINNFIEYLEHVLGLTDLEVIQDASFFKSKTQMASADVKNKIIYIRPNTAVNLDLYFALAHESRHIWQYNNSEYKMSIKNHIDNTKISIEQYNNQTEEIDAHAFATVIMEVNFGVAPIFDGLSASTRKAIMKRAGELRSLLPLTFLQKSNE